MSVFDYKEKEDWEAFLYAFPLTLIVIVMWGILSGRGKPSAEDRLKERWRINHLKVEPKPKQHIHKKLGKPSQDEEVA